MKKHSGTVLLIGVMALIFGLLLMGTVNAVSDMISGPSLAVAGAGAADVAQAAGSLSIGVIVLGVAMLGLGTLMRSGPD